MYCVKYRCKIATSGSCDIFHSLLPLIQRMAPLTIFSDTLVWNQLMICGCWIFLFYAVLYPSVIIRCSLSLLEPPHTDNTRWLNELCSSCKICWLFLFLLDHLLVDSLLEKMAVRLAVMTFLFVNRSVTISISSAPEDALSFQSSHDRVHIWWLINLICFAAVLVASLHTSNQSVQCHH